MATYGKNFYILGNKLAIIQIDTSSFHGEITPSKYSAFVGETIRLSARMQDGYSLKSYVVNGSQIVGSSFSAIQGVNTVSAIDTGSVSVPKLLAPSLTFVELVANGSDLAKLKVPTLSVLQITANQSDTPPKISLNAPSLSFLEIMANQSDAYQKIVITNIYGDWSGSVYEMRIYLENDVASLKPDIYINGSLFTGTKSYISGAVWLDYPASSNGQVISVKVSKYGYEDSDIKTHSIPSKPRMQLNKPTLTLKEVKQVS